MRKKKATVDQVAAPTYPELGEVFELTLDFDLSENQPLEMVRRDGYSPKGWDYRGKRLTGIQTHKFKLVQVGYCSNFDEARRKILIHGEIPEGQWRQAFKVAYPRPDGKGPVGVADSSWADPEFRADFPCVSTDGLSYFRWAGHDFDGRWRWLVETK